VQAVWLKVVTFAALVLSAAPTKAATVEIFFEFEITSGNNSAVAAALGQSAPSSISGSLTFDDALAPLITTTNASAVISNYLAAATFNYGNLSASYSLDGTTSDVGDDIFRILDFVSGALEIFVLNAGSDVDAGSGVTLAQSFLFINGTGGSINSLSDLEDFLLGNSFASADAGMAVLFEGGSTILRGRSVFFTDVAPIPLPASVFLIAPGIGGLAVSRRLSRRRVRS